MNFWRSLSGMVEVRLTSADISGALATINSTGVEIFDACQLNDLTIDFKLQRNDYRKVRKVAKKRGESLALVRRQGLYWALKRILKRPVIVCGLVLILFLTIYLPGQIYFVEVQGNTTISATMIIEKAADCGIRFGARRSEVRSERMKNVLLQAIPELQWAGINTYGCRAVISVKERPQQEQSDPVNQVSSIVACRDGIIQQITVQSGNRLCVPGQAVKQGQVLISGYTDCGICIRATRAQGEVYALTQRQQSTVLPLEYAKKGQIVDMEKKYGLLLGKKLINFCKGSGISTTSCDKMYAVNYITLPGGLRLPVAVVTETLVYYESSPVTLTTEQAQSMVEDFAADYLRDMMIAGEIRDQLQTIEWNDNLCILHGQYACVEMIGKTRLEENIHDYGQTH